MTTARAQSRRTGRGSVLLLVGVALLVGSAFTPWARRWYDDSLTGARAVTLQGADILPALVPVALVILAAWALAMLSRGAVRRVLAICSAIAAGGVVAATVLAVDGGPDDADFAARLARPAAAVGDANLVFWSVAMALLGGVAAAVGAVLISLTRGAVRRPSGDYDAHDSPATRRAAAAREAAQTRRSAAPISGEAAAEQLWRGLDVGVDLTEDARGAAQPGDDS